MQKFIYRIDKVYNWMNPYEFQNELNTLSDQGWELYWVLEPVKEDFAIIILRKER